MGACFGFLWWNASPAKIFMGDTGSLALGGALAGLAIITRTELLLVVLGGLFVLITLSVIIQVGSFKLTGKRVFRMAPLQHHFELLRLGRGDDRHPVLDHRRPVRRPRARGVLRRVGGRRRDDALARDPRRADGWPLTDAAPAWAGLRVLVAGIGVAGSPRPTRCSSAARRCSSSTARDGAAPGRAERARILEILGARLRARRGLRGPAARRGRRPRRHLAGLAPGPAAARRRRRRRRTGVGRGRAGLADAPGQRCRPLAHPHRHQRQDHDGAHARRRCSRGRGLRARRRRQRGHARSSRRCCTRTPTTCWPSSCRASSCTGRPPSRPQARLPQRRARPRRLARLLRGLRRDKGRVYERTEVACVYNVADPQTERLVERGRGAARAAAPSASPSASPRRRMLGVVDDVLADRAFVAQRRHVGRRARRPSPNSGRRPRRSRRTTSPTPWPPRRWPAPTACRPGPSGDGLRGFRPEPAPDRHASRPWPRCATSTTPRPPTRTRQRPRCAAYEHVVWVAGGLLKGADVDDLVAGTRPRLRGVVLIGRDRARIAEALARHAPEVPVVDARRPRTLGP